MYLYKTKAKYVEAEQIDEALRLFLMKNGYDNVKIGDYYLKDQQGRYAIWSKAGFEAIFEEDGDI